MDRCDFSSIMAIMRSYISKTNQLNQSEFLYEIFEDYINSPSGKDFTFANGLVCRWMTGQAKVSPKIIDYYSTSSRQKSLAKTIHQNILPMMFDCNKALEDVYTLFIQDPSISEGKKEKLIPLYKTAATRMNFLAKIISFGMERTFVKRDSKKQKLISSGTLSPILMDYIMDSEVPLPCRHFCGRNTEIDELHTQLPLRTVFCPLS